MASSSSSSPVFFLITLFHIILISNSSIIILPLSHTLSTTKLNTTNHLLKSSTTHSTTRFHHHRNRQISLPLSPGTDYTLSFSLGSQTISLYMDTGSDVVWLPCHPFECILCQGEYSPSSIPHPTPLTLNLTSSTPTNCISSACSSVHSSLPSSDLCAVANCPLESIEVDECQSYSCPPFYYAYGDGSFVAKLYEDTLSIPMSNPSLKLPKFTFGCANTALGEPIGVAGFGRGPLSLPTQLAKNSPEIGNYFSYCLVSHAFKAKGIPSPSPLILGRYQKKQSSDDENDDEVVYYSYTRMLDNPKHKYFYCVGLEAISVGKRRIRAPESLRRIDGKGDGGMVVDSGTTFTMLPKKFYNSLVDEFHKRVGSVYKRAGRVEDMTGLSPCYYGRVEEKYFVNVPGLVLHFGGNSSMKMPRINYFKEFYDSQSRRNVGCLMVMDGGDDADNGGGPAGLLGNYQQQGFEVVYDLEEKRVGFARRECASLWDALKK